MAKLGRRRILGLVLLLGGLVALPALLVLNPFPAHYGSWSTGGEGSALLKSEGPALAARYDASTDTTVAVLPCGAEPCAVAAQLAGNATEAVQKRNLILFASSGAMPQGEVDLAEPIPVLGTNVTQMTAARFEVGSAYLPLLLYQLAFLAVAVGAFLVVRLEDEPVLGGAVGAAAGMALGFVMAANGAYHAVFWPALLLVLSFGAVGVSLVMNRRHPRGASGAAFALGFGAAVVFSWVVATRYYAHGPTL